MKSTKTKAFRLIEKFDKQLRDLLTAEIKSVRNTRDALIIPFRQAGGDDYQIA